MGRPVHRADKVAQALPQRCRLKRSGASVTAKQMHGRSRIGQRTVLDRLIGDRDITAPIAGRSRR